METKLLGEKIYHQRKVKGLSQEDLADKIGVSRQAISKWETNAMQPTLDNVKSLCTVFDVCIEYFTGEDTKEESVEELAVSAENTGSETKSKKQIGFIIGIAVVSALFAISLLITVIIGMDFFTTNTGEGLVNSSNVYEETFAAALICSIILFVADIALICVLLLKKRANVNKS